MHTTGSFILSNFSSESDFILASYFSRLREVFCKWIQQPVLLCFKKKLFHFVRHFARHFPKTIRHFKYLSRFGGNTDFKVEACLFDCPQNGNSGSSLFRGRLDQNVDLSISFTIEPKRVSLTERAILVSQATQITRNTYGPRIVNFQ